MARSPSTLDPATGSMQTVMLQRQNRQWTLVELSGLLTCHLIARGRVR